MTTIQTRVPQKLDDEQAMRTFHDRLDRTHLRVGQLDDLDSAAVSATDLALRFNELLEQFRLK